MKYFIDTEFHEGFYKPFLGNKRHFIDLISIGIVAEDGREYYAISKDFDIKAAWNAHEVIPFLTSKNHSLNDRYEYWLRDHVLELIFDELVGNWATEEEKANRFSTTSGYNFPMPFNFKNFKKVINRYGKSNRQIAEEIKWFCKSGYINIGENAPNLLWDGGQLITRSEPEFYGYYCDYDWVVFCSLFGKMINLPNDFPMYCKDLKQALDEAAISRKTGRWVDRNGFETKTDFEIKNLKAHPDYPKQSNEHNALADARWNKDLLNFLITL